jgi:predicted metal-dependent hydrolase
MRALLQNLRQLAFDFFDAAGTTQAVPIAQGLEKKQPLALVEYAGEATNLVASNLPEAPTVSISSVLPPLSYRHPRATHEVVLAGCLVAYEFKRVKRKSIGFVISPDGLLVSAPKWVPMKEVDSVLQDKAAWVLKKLAALRERQTKSEAQRIVWQDGAALPFLGEPVIVLLDPRHAFDGSAQLSTDANALPGVPKLTLHIGLPHNAAPERIRDAVQAWLMRQAKRVFEERLNHYAPQLKVQWRKLSLSSAGTRWGSAGADGSIRLNWRLIHFKLSTIDYVVVHELSHLRVMDHSPRFWNTVESILPDYSARKSELKDEALPVWH